MPPPSTGKVIVTLGVDPVDKPNAPFKKGNKASRTRFTRGERLAAMTNQVRCDTVKELIEKVCKSGRIGAYMLILGRRRPTARKPRALIWSSEATLRRS